MHFPSDDLEWLTFITGFQGRKTESGRWEGSCAGLSMTKAWDSFTLVLVIHYTWSFSLVDARFSANTFSPIIGGAVFNAQKFGLVQDSLIHWLRCSWWVSLLGRLHSYAASWFAGNPAIHWFLNENCWLKIYCKRFTACYSVHFMFKSESISVSNAARCHDFCTGSPLLRFVF